MDDNNPDTPQTYFYRNENNRLASFIGWRYQDIITKEELARDGFYNLNIAGTDKVRCVFCGLIMHQWVKGDVARKDHEKYAKRCPFLQGFRNLNVSIEEEREKREKAVVWFPDRDPMVRLNPWLRSAVKAVHIELMHK